VPLEVRPLGDGDGDGDVAVPRQEAGVLTLIMAREARHVSLSRTWW
jgi:hypothetical protein